MIRRARWCAAVAALALAVPTPVANAARPTAVDRAHRLFMVSDSVGLGAVSAMRNSFSGWQVTITGKPGLFTEMLVKYVNDAPATAFGDNAIVATGYNYPYWDSPRFDRSVDQMVAALKARGVHRIFWVTMREVTPKYYSHWNGLTSAYRTLYLAYPHTNDQLRAATVRHPELSIIDWASVADQTGLSYDAIHLNPTGAAQYAALARSTIDTALTRLGTDVVTEIPIAGLHGVPADAAAVSLHVTAINPRSNGVVTVAPCGAAAPKVGTLTRPGRTSSTATVVPLGASGSVCVRQTTETNVAVDVDGAFGATSGYHRTGPRRVLATGTVATPSGVVRTVNLTAATGAPAGPFVAIVGITTSSSVDGQMRVFTCGTAPSPVPTRSYGPGFREQTMQFVRTDADGNICVVTTGGATMTIDVHGWFDGAGDVRGLRTRRVVDSRSTGGALAPGDARAIKIAGVGPVYSSATGVVATLTLLDPGAIGTASVYPCAAGPADTTAVHTVPNHSASAVVAIGLDGGGQLCVRSTVRSQFTLDVTGWMGPSFVAIPPRRLLDTRGYPSVAMADCCT